MFENILLISQRGMSNLYTNLKEIEQRLFSSESDNASEWSEMSTC
jgi:hypothetical protein